MASPLKATRSVRHCRSDGLNPILGSRAHQQISKTRASLCKTGKLPKHIASGR
jgi:hypothetical protein